jgi:MFS transporter, OFA family, oxalate/formate antiporter
VNKYCSLFAALVMMLCLGGIYSWSIYVAPLTTQYALSTAQTQWIFGVMIAVFTVTMVGAGRLITRFGPRPLALIGAGLFGAGYWCAAWSDGRFLLLVTGLSILSGMGTGLAYLAALTTPVQWFPHQRGFITGVTVAGFGGGAVACSTLVEMLLLAGVPVGRIFAIIGSSYGLVLGAAALALTTPSSAGAAVSETPRFPLMRVIRDRQFWPLWAGMFAGTCAGLLIIGNLKPIALASGASESAATLGISLFAVGNACGRVGWGRVADLVKGAWVPAAALAALALSVLLVLPGAGYDGVFLGLAVLVGVNFGANFVVYAAEVLRVYGAQHFGQLYPLVFLAYGVAGIFGPQLGGWLFDRMGGYSAAIILATLLCLGGVGVLGLRRNEDADGRKPPRSVNSG